MSIQTVAVIGLGYVGLPTAAILANRGVDVLGVDVNVKTVERINRGQVHIVEPDLDIMVRGAVQAGKLRAATTPEAADAFIIAVPTPFKGIHTPDLSYIEQAAASIAPALKKGDLVVIESTCPVGTAEKVSGWLADARADLSFPRTGTDAPDVSVAHSPERVLPGRVLIEMVQNDRIVGGLTERCTRRAMDLYGLFVSGSIMPTDATTAELVKLAENAYRDVNIAFANELSRVSDTLGLNVWDVIDLANHHPRVDILNPGPGVGGHCIAVDPWFIVDSAPDVTPLIQAARGVNDAKPLAVVDAALKALDETGAKAIACLGLSYKADIDDLRESPAVDIVTLLAEKAEAAVLVVEPHVEVLPGALAAADGVRLCDMETALGDAGVVLLLTDHREFRAIDPDALAAKRVIDTRGIWRNSSGKNV